MSVIKKIKIPVKFSSKNEQKKNKFLNLDNFSSYENLRIEITREVNKQEKTFYKRYKR